MSRHSVDTKALQAVLDYLVERPYKETFQLVQGIQNSAQVVVETPHPVLEEAKEEPFTPPPRDWFDSAGEGSTGEWK